MHTNIKLDRDIQCAVLTVSDTRDYKTDKGGNLIITLLSEINASVEKGHYCIVKDDISEILEQLKRNINQCL